MSAETYRKAVEQYMEALSNGDLEQIMDLYAADATVEDPVGTEIKRGSDAIREFYATGAVNNKFRAQLTGPVRVAGKEAAFPFRVDVSEGDSALAIEIIDTFLFDDAGKVVSMRAFWGPENMQQQG